MFEAAHVKLHVKVKGGLISDKKWLPLELKKKKSVKVAMGFEVY